MKHSHNHDFHSTLHNKRLKSTPLRLALLEVMTHENRPMTAEEISNALRKNEFDRATLFRTLKTFSETGIISAVDLGGNCLRYEMNCQTHHHHHHIICTACKKIETVPFCIPDEFKKFLIRKGYKKVTHRMDFSGLCKECH